MIQKRENGFTLVELAIALMVIGLLIGGVLKGQELIENARITRVVKDLNDYDAAVMIFRGAYNALPGDIRNPTRIPNCDSAPCNNVVGVGNGQIAESNNSGNPSTAVKAKNFWIHLERAGLITGNDEDENFTKIRSINALEGWFVASYTATGNPDLTADPAMNSINLRQSYPNHSDRYFSPKTANTLDQKMDDGKPLSGTFIAARSITTGSHGTSAPLTNCIDDTTKEYLNTEPEVGRCLILVRLGSLQ